VDPTGVERYRIEGYLPKDWFRARLELGRARVAFMRKKFADAQELYASIADRFSSLELAAEALYWRDVCKYKATNDHTVLEPVAKELAEKFPGDEWQLKSVPWASAS
jgi:hypothetical protein